ncbi:hypothetical protein PG994_009688 [Apiospora phragmitis]|uniref:Uncharacterized protein n=1 Tax=Apiospora phragmitis TaxID=2905665 RepID=A0ABR1U8Y7_9PEZI
MTSHTGIFTSAVSVESALHATPTPSLAPSTNPGPGGGAIAGIIVGAIVGLAILAALCWLIFRYRRKALGSQPSNEQVQEIMSHRGPDDFPGLQSNLEQQNQYQNEDRYELGGPDHIPQQRQQQYQKPELDASTSEMLQR